MKASPAYLGEYDIKPDMDTVIMVKGGNLILRNSLISTLPIPKNVKVNIPALVTLQGSRANIISTEFRGNEFIMTSGILSINADLLLSHCQMSNYKGGGILVQS